MCPFKIFGRRKRRKYPIKRDENGVSARRRYFEMFQQKVPVDEIVKRVGVSVDTVSGGTASNGGKTQVWKSNVPYSEISLRKRRQIGTRISNCLQETSDWGKEELEAILSKPHGIRRLITRKYYFPLEADADHKRHIVLKLAVLISDHLVTQHGKFADLYFALKRDLPKFAEYRKEGEEDITAQNRIMPLIHEIFKIEIENEKKGGVQPDELSKDERDTAMRLLAEKVMKETRVDYWVRIVTLMREGHNEEQAREKIYQDLLAKGDLKGAKLIREFQDKVHPLKKGDQSPSKPDPQPPSPT